MFSFGGPTGTGFGTTSTAPTGFSFGTSTTTPSTGFSFGTPSTASTGFSFGTSTATPSTGFSFGTSTATPSTGFGFGTTTSSAPSTGFGFGTAASSVPATGGFGFGTSTSSAPNTGFSFGTATTTSSTGFGFGSTATAAPATGFGFGFGAQPKTTASTGFGGFGGFGSTATTSAPSFGFGTTGTTASTGFGFGQAATGGLFGQQQQAQPTAQDELNLLVLAVQMPQLFGDERDAVIMKWNQLQAMWGTGKSPGNQSVPFKPDNPFCKFKAVGYNCLPSGKNEDGFVKLIIKEPLEKVKSFQQQAIDTLHKILGNKPQHTVCVEAVNALPDNMTELVIYVMERPQMGPSRRCAAVDLYNELSQPNTKQQLTSNLNVDSVTAKVLTKEQLKQYLDNPPAGLNPLLWQQAMLDNPDPEQFIPVPVIGFQELHKRLKFQDQQTKLHQQKLDLIAQDLTAFKNKQSNMMAKMDEYKRKHLELGHRLLQVIVKQEVLRKQGFAIQADEEHLRVQLESIQGELNHPTQFKGRLNELMSQIRMQNHLSSSAADISYKMDPTMLQEIKLLLKHHQDGLKHLIDITKEDMQDLNIIETGLADSSSLHR